MRAQLIIHLQNTNSDQVRWMRVEPDKGASPVATSTLLELSSQVQGAQLVVLVPSAEILLTRVAIPTTNRQKVLKAIPFALEDHLAGNVDDLHFAMGKRESDGKLAVAVVSRQLMDGWQQRCRDAGLQPHFMIPDVLALPYAQGQWSVLSDEHNAMMRVGAQVGMSADPENMQFICQLNLEQEDEPAPEKIRVWTTGDTGEWQTLASDELQMECHEHTGGLLGLIGSMNLLEQGINLLQGDYSRREQIGKLWRPWRVAASLLGVWFVIQLGVTISENMELSAKKEQLSAEVTRLYKQAVPDAKRIVNVKVQMERKLEELRGGSSVNGAPFLAMLSDAGEVLRNGQGVVLRSVRYKNSEMDIELDVPNLQSLDELKQRLTANNKLAVEIQSAASKDNKVQGRLHIKSNG